MVWVGEVLEELCSYALEVFCAGSLSTLDLYFELLIWFHKDHSVRPLDLLALLHTLNNILREADIDTPSKPGQNYHREYKHGNGRKRRWTFFLWEEMYAVHIFSSSSEEERAQIGSS